MCAAVIAGSPEFRRSAGDQGLRLDEDAARSTVHPGVGDRSSIIGKLAAINDGRDLVGTVRQVGALWIGGKRQEALCTEFPCRCGLSQLVSEILVDRESVNRPC